MGRKRKFEGIAAQLRVRIRDDRLSPGEALPSERDLAREYDVTRLTLRKAVDLLIQDGILIRQHGRGMFVAARADSAGREKVVYIGSTEEHFYQTFHSRLCVEGQVRGRQVVAFTPSEESVDLASLELLLKEAVGVICVHNEWPRVHSLVPDGTTVVRVTGFESFEPEDLRDGDRGCVLTTDTYRAAKLAVEHLCELGHTRIGLMDTGHVRNEDDELLWKIRPRRPPYLGYRSALREAGVYEEFILGTPPKPVDGWKDKDKHAAKRYLEQLAELPSAFVCVGDFRAGPLIRAATEMGIRVPDDMSVVGMGNTPWAQWLTPPLTTIALGEDELASLAILLAVEPELPPTTIFRVTPHLVARQSVKGKSGQEV